MSEYVELNSYFPDEPEVESDEQVVVDTDETKTPEPEVPLDPEDQARYDILDTFL
jgi:hypothetical protein